MSSKFEFKTIGELSLNYDSKRIPVKSNERNLGPYPYYGASGIVDYIDDYLFEGLHLLVSEDGENLRTRKTPIAFLADGKYWVNNHAHILKGIPNVADTKFLMYALSQTDISGFLTGSTQPKLTQDNLNHIRIPAPNYHLQKIIANILSSLDDKIELNRQMCKTLEDIASTLFKSWFIDFDPVKAKAQGREPEGLSREIAVLFPDSFVDSHLGPIPSGWKTGKLKNIINQIKPTVNPANFPAEVFFHYSLPSYDTSKIPATVYGTSIKSNKTIISQDCVLLSKLNPETARVWLPQKQNRLRSVCSTEFLAYEPTGYFSRDYLYCLFLESSFRATLHGMVTGTSKSHQRVQPRAILELNCLIPPQQIIESFDNSMKALFNYIEVINIQSCTLAQMRDSLLPKLIIGELKIKDEKVDCGR